MVSFNPLVIEAYRLRHLWGIMAQALPQDNPLSPHHPPQHRHPRRHARRFQQQTVGKDTHPLKTRAKLSIERLYAGSPPAILRPFNGVSFPSAHQQP